MSIQTKALHDLYCRLACYSSVMYKQVSNICSCYPDCKQLNTYHTYSHKNVPARFSKSNSLGELLSQPCGCMKVCRLTQTSIIDKALADCNENAKET